MNSVLSDNQKKSEMSTNPLFSIIIPVYNAKDYIQRCLDSILRQSYDCFEVLMIDDGSSDGSSDICDAYAAKDPRFRVFHRENHGVSCARNLGLAELRGEWFTFVDADDYLLENALQTYHSHISEEIDMVSAYYRKVDNQGNILKQPETQCAKIISFEEALLDQYEPIVEAGLFNGYIWDKLFRTSIMREHSIRFKEKIHVKEDGLFIVEFICQSRRNVFLTSEVVYGYFQNENSVMNGLHKSYNPKYLTDIDACCLCYKAIREVSEEPHLLEISKNFIYYIHRAVRGHIFHQSPFNMKAWWQLFAKTIKGTSLGFLLGCYTKTFTSKFRRKKA